MRFSSSRLTVAVSVLLLCGAGAYAQTHETKETKTTTQTKTSTVQLGNRTILIPDPDGFEEAASQFPNIKERMTVTEAPANDMLFVHMLVSDCDRMRRGERPTYDQYTKISVLKAARELLVTRPMMAGIVDGFRKSVTNLLDPNQTTMQDFEKHAEQALSRLTSQPTQFDIGKPEYLGEFGRRPDVASFLMLVHFKATSGTAEKAVRLLMTANFVLVKDKVVFVYAYRKYNGIGDVATLKEFTTNWTNSILGANRGQ